MTLEQHEAYAQKVLSSLSDEYSAIESLPFQPNPKKKRNAAKAMTEIVCHRLWSSSQHNPVQIRNSHFEWNGGALNCRNISDRDDFWTNVRRSVAAEMRESASRKPALYLMSSLSSKSDELRVWAIPEPIVDESLSRLPSKKTGGEFSVEISHENQRFEHDPRSPNLTQYFGEYHLSRHEAELLQLARAIDETAKATNKKSEEDEEEIDDIDELMSEREIQESLDGAASKLDAAAEFEPANIIDARDWVMTSIVRRRGQPAFRQSLLAAYDGRCAISGCDVEAVLEAAHIVRYQGAETNHVCNGLLLRADLHTLFDLRLIAVDVTKMTVLVSPMLANTQYSEFQGQLLRLPTLNGSRPSCNALEVHRDECGL